VVVGRLYTVPPRAWSQIHIGDSAEQVRVKWPTVDRYLHDIKGAFCYRPLVLGYWRLWIIYGPDDKVSKKYCILRLGTRNNFKDFDFDD
jgi:hypothetical protein